MARSDTIIDAQADLAFDQLASGANCIQRLNSSIAFLIDARAYLRELRYALPTIAMIYHHHDEIFKRLPEPIIQGYILVEYISVVLLWTRTSKGITDLLLLQTYVA